MTRYSAGLVWLLTLLLGVSSLAQPATLITKQRVTVFADAKAGLNSDKKQKLRMTCTGQGVNPSFFLDAGIHLKILSRGSFDTREVMNDTATSTAQKEMKVLYHCALVEVLEGANEGRRGWVVLSRDVVGRYADVWIEPDLTVEAPGGG